MNDAVRLTIVRGVHTAIYVGMSFSMFAVFFAGLVGARGSWLFVALALVAIELLRERGFSEAQIEAELKRAKRTQQHQAPGCLLGALATVGGDSGSASLPSECEVECGVLKPPKPQTFGRFNEIGARWRRG